MKDRIETLKGYLKRLGNGEPLEAVRKDFVEVFKDVDPAEIMKAEQEMLAEGTPLSDVQKLCDVHAALFHGKTREEQIANAERGSACVNTAGRAGDKDAGAGTDQFRQRQGQTDGYIVQLSGISGMSADFGL